MRNAFVMISLMTVLITSCSQNKEGKVPGVAPGGAAGAAMVKDYTVLKLSPISVTVNQDFPATIEGQQVIEIRPMINGYVEEIHVNEGDYVRKGQLLFKIRNPQYEQEVLTARASVNSAVAEINSAKIEVEKVKPLVEKDIISGYRLQSAELTLRTKEAQLEQAKASLTNAEANLAYTVIKSPQDGTIGTIPYKVGALVSSSSAEALTMLSDISTIFAYFSWNEKQLLELLSQTPGTSVEEKIKAMPPAKLILANGIEYTEAGRIEMASGLISTVTGSATFKAIFKNTDGIIRSGSSAIIKVPKNYDSVLVVPQSATYELQDKRFIYTVSTDNKVTAVNFNSIPTDDGKFFVVTSGLKPGDRIVTEGIVSLKDGNTIIPKDTSHVSYYGKLY
jgi:membrane fusion protein, multidrug efflux system